MRKIFFISLIACSSVFLFPLKSLATTPVYIFAEQGSVFLGCVNCDKYENNSLNNRYSDYGSPYSAYSVFNRYGEYGNRYSETSACNSNASNPPYLVDGDGNFLGFLTVNRRIESIGLDSRTLGACH